MHRNFIDHLKDNAGVAIRQTSLIAAIAILLFITTSFLCAAAFVCIFQRFGLVSACLTGAGIFFVVTLFVTGCYMYSKKQAKKRRVETTKSAFATVMSDPMIVSIGLQIVRAVGVKRLLSLLAICGIALGVVTRRKSSEEMSAK